MAEYCILKGEKGTGKTTSLLHLVNNCKLNTAGVLTFAVGKDRYLFNIDTKEKIKLTADCETTDGIYKIGHYCFYKNVFEKGNEIILCGNKKETDLLIVDEAGFLELENKGFDNSMKTLVSENNLNAQKLLVVVRTFLVNKIIEKYFKNKQITVLTVNDLTDIKK
jgi:nucleoside-triphosphatase THEP1